MRCLTSLIIILLLLTGCSSIRPDRTDYVKDLPEQHETREILPNGSGTKAFMVTGSESESNSPGNDTSGIRVSYRACPPEPEFIPETTPRETPAPTPWIIPDVLFDFNQSTIKDRYFDILDDVAIQLQKNPDINMDLLGHADNIGTDHYNLVLSVKRANTVLNYLLQKPNL